MQHPLSSKFARQIERLAYTRSIRDVFTDLIDTLLFPMIIQDGASLARNAFPSYKPDEQATFRELMLTFGEIADNDGTGLYDALGDLFMEHLSHGRNGQFFTPQEICDMMAMMQGTPEDGQSVLDCACGSGRMLLAMAKQNRNLTFHGSDIDLVCAKMAALNLATNTLRGEIAWMNTLTMEHWASFHIHRCPFTRLPYIITTGPGQTHFIQRVRATFEQPKAEQPADPAPAADLKPIIINQPLEQLKLF